MNTEQPKKNNEISDEDDDQEQDINELENYKAPKPEGPVVFFENFNEDPFANNRWVVTKNPKYTGISLKKKVMTIIL